MFAVWVPVLESDTLETSRRGPPEMPDPRVIHCYDSEARTSRWFLQSVVADWPLRQRPVFRKGLIWDAFFLYGPDTGWEELPDRCQVSGATILRDRALLQEAFGRP
ncbi:MAG: hypothetical protein AB1758_23770 [Candidatus Eremiobacterota bacterium]